MAHGDEVGRVTLEDVVAAVRGSWSADTRDPAEEGEWTPVDPARGQCGTTALVVHDLLGGDLVLAEVRRRDGSRQGVHYWNRLPDGREVDLTREQFRADEVVGPGEVLARPAGLPRRGVAEYLLLRERTFSALRLAVPPLP